MKAFIFDLNGTMIDDMEFHNKAWQWLLNDKLGGKFTQDEVKRQMYGKNPEVLVRIFGVDKYSAEEMDKLSMEKEKQYQAEFLPHLRLIPGLNEFLEMAYQRGIPMAIGSAAIPFNIDFVLDNLNIRHYFKTIVSADDVHLSKPHPETYLIAAERLQVKPADCIVFEDVPKGVEAAAKAGIQAVVLTTTHQQYEFDYLNNIIHFSPDFIGGFFEKLVNN